MTKKAKEGRDEPSVYLVQSRRRRAGVNAHCSVGYDERHRRPPLWSVNVISRGASASAPTQPPPYESAAAVAKRQGRIDGWLRATERCRRPPRSTANGCSRCRRRRRRVGLSSDRFCPSMLGFFEILTTTASIRIFLKYLNHR